MAKNNDSLAFLMKLYSVDKREALRMQILSDYGLYMTVIGRKKVGKEYFTVYGLW